MLGFCQRQSCQHFLTARPHGSSRGYRTRPALVLPARATATSMDVKEVVEDAVVWASQHGLVVALLDPTGVMPEGMIHAPLALLPVEFPRDRFLQAKAAMTTFNTLVDAVANDEEYLESTLHAAAQHDDFTAQLLDVLRKSRSTRQQLASQGRDVVLGVHRSDYMLDAPSGGFLQVELNTIASSFGCLSALTSGLHAYIADRLDQDKSSLPANPTLTSLPAALATAADAAETASGMPNGSGIVVMVVQARERNVYDQQWLAAGLWEKHRRRVKRMSLTEVAEQVEVGSDGIARLPGGKPISLFYFRAGYTPNDYEEKGWQARLLIEQSAAAKCPSIAYQLAGAKKVQQDLARPGVLERFVAADGAAKLRPLFAGLWGLDDLSSPETAAIVAEALARPEAFVLKPQREGGGNNFYGAELAAKLSAGGPDLSAFILMQRILPPRQTSVLVRNCLWEEAEVVSELGIYGTFVRRGSKVELNEEAGHLVRTKKSSSNEGGVAAGFAVLDSPRLV